MGSAGNLVGQGCLQWKQRFAVGAKLLASHLGALIMLGGRQLPFPRFNKYVFNSAGSMQFRRIDHEWRMGAVDNLIIGGQPFFNVPEEV